jgi:urate oxidase
MLGPNSYGKSDIRLVKLRRAGDRHEIVDLTVAVKLEGSFEAAHSAGNNRDIVPTDTMKNTVYAMAKEHSLDPIEEFALDLAAHFLRASPAASRVTVTLGEHPWDRLTVGDRPHPRAFVRSGSETRVAMATRTRDSQEVEAGLEGLVILKSGDSAFAGFRRDAYTTLTETRDRVLATSVSARWKYSDPDVAYGVAARGIRATLLEVFAEHKSESVQHTLWAMGEAVLERHAEVGEIHLTLPNKHHIEVDLAPFGLANEKEIFVATEEPYGLIEATVRRSP